ncbi:MAG TPA: glycoside hydrolase family 9 protein, partial [Chlamydiales bacterium]|nr:glycoside hydrolase family 9 protein [Chlamydiales bacterium]
YILEWTEQEGQTAQVLLLAKLELFRTTKNDRFLEKIEAITQTAYKQLRKKGFLTAFKAFLAHRASNELPEKLAELWRRLIYTQARLLVGLANKHPYRVTIPVHEFSTSWSELNPTLLAEARLLLIAYDITKDLDFKEVAIHNLDFVFGANPSAMSWTTGVGVVFPTEVYQTTIENDPYYEQVPGLTLIGLGQEGLRPRWEKPFSQLHFLPFLQPHAVSVPLFHRWSAHPRNIRQNRFSLVQTIGPSVYCTAMLLCDNWKPDELLKTMKPKLKSELPGYYPLP